MITRHRNLTWALLVTILLFLFASLALAQRTVNLAYVNTGGQLVITDSNATSRWVVTNPGESLLADVNLAWAPNSDQLFFGVQAGGTSSLRVANPSSTTVAEIASVNGGVLGGEWTPNGQAVLVGLNDGIYQLGANGAARLISNAQVTTGQLISPNGRFLFYYHGSGFAVDTISGGNQVALPGRNNVIATGVGLWAPNSPFVAHWGFGDTGTSVLVVTNAASGDSVVLDSGSSVPVTPLVWQAETLLFRGATGVQAINLACLANGCGSTPSAVNILPVDAANVSIDGNVLVFSRAEQIFGANANCANNGDCASNAVQLGSLANTYLSVMDNTAAYTTTDGSIQAVNLSCVGSGGCNATNTGVRGNIQMFAPNGEQVLAVSSNRLQIINLSNLADSTIIDGVGSNSRLAWGT